MYTPLEHPSPLLGLRPGQEQDTNAVREEEADGGPTSRTEGPTEEDVSEEAFQRRRRLNWALKDA